MLKKSFGISKTDLEETAKKLFRLEASLRWMIFF
jgi:hypothetical protein